MAASVGVGGGVVVAVVAAAAVFEELREAPVDHR